MILRTLYFFMTLITYRHYIEMVFFFITEIMMIMLCWSIATNGAFLSGCRRNFPMANSIIYSRMRLLVVWIFCTVIMHRFFVGDLSIFSLFIFLFLFNKIFFVVYAITSAIFFCTYFAKRIVSILFIFIAMEFTYWLFSIANRANLIFHVNAPKQKSATLHLPFLFRKRLLYKVADFCRQIKRATFPEQANYIMERGAP